MFEKLRGQQPGLAGEIDALLNSGYGAGRAPTYAPLPSQPTEPQVVDGGNVPWQRRRWRHYGMDGDAVPAGSTLYRERPIRPATVESNVGVPFLEALITGLFVSLATIAVHIAANWPGNLLVVALVAFAVPTCVAWLVFRSAHHKLLWLHEEIAGRDLDGDGMIGQPEQPRPEKQTILLRTHSGDSLAFSAMIDGTEVPQDKLMAFVADGFKRGYTLDMARRCDLERPEWESIIDTMERANLVSPKSQGVDARPLVAREVILAAMMQL